MANKEFPTQFDWMHNGEGLAVFNLMGLSNPRPAAFEQRVRRYAGFYMNEDPGAPNSPVSEMPEARTEPPRSFRRLGRGPAWRRSTRSARCACCVRRSPSRPVCGRAVAAHSA